MKAIAITGHGTQPTLQDNLPSPNTHKLELGIRVDVEVKLGDAVGDRRVVLRSPPSAHADSGLFHFIDEQGPPSLAWVGRQLTFAGRAAGLVDERFGPAVLPTQGMRADQALVASIAHMHRVFVA